MVDIILLSLFFLAWGSFLNVVGHRLINGGRSFRSHCPECKHTLLAKDIIPLISYAVLGGNCRHCNKKISWIYPMIELFTTLSMIAGYYAIDDSYHLAFFIFFSALIITIRSDLEHMLISQWATIALIPVGLLLSFFDQLPILPLNSIFGAAVGYFLPWLVGKIFFFATQKKGIGEGDFDLLAFIGAFTGLLGVWISLLVGSIIGSIIGGIYLYRTGQIRRHIPLPFGPFLAAGAMIYALFYDVINEFLLGN